MPPSSRPSSLLRVLAFAAPALLARADSLPLSMKFCTDGGCNTGCTEWQVKASGECAPGTAGNSWVRMKIRRLPFG